MVSVGAIGKKTMSQMAQESQFPSANSQECQCQDNDEESQLAWKQTDKAGGFWGGIGSFKRQKSMGTAAGGIHTLNLKISPTQNLEKRTKGPVMVGKPGCWFMWRYRIVQASGIDGYNF